LGLAGEEAVLQTERTALIAGGRPGLTKLISHVSKIEGDGAGYDIKSFTLEGEDKFIEVKTTRGDMEPSFVSVTMKYGSLPSTRATTIFIGFLSSTRRLFQD
jgi:hypothetical protein